METSMVKQMLDSADDLETLESMASIVPDTPQDMHDTVLLATRTWRLGKVFREFTLALLARAAIEKTYSKAVKYNGECQICHKFYEDIDVMPPPLSCDDCGAIFARVPMIRHRLQRYPTWLDVEDQLANVIDVAHGTIGQRIVLYKRMLDIGLSWQEAYEAILVSPMYCDKLLSAFRWNSRGELVHVPDKTVIPARIKGAQEKIERLEMAREFIRDKITSETAVISDRFVKSEMIRGAAEMSGNPVVDVFDGPPSKPLHFLVVVNYPSEDISSVEEVYALQLLRDGKPVNPPRELKEVIARAVSSKNPVPAVRARIWGAKVIE